MRYPVTHVFYYTINVNSYYFSFFCLTNFGGVDISAVRGFYPDHFEPDSKQLHWQKEAQPNHLGLGKEKATIRRAFTDGNSTS